jgi:hypothetical protein
LAATNKCLAQSNKSRHVSRATKDEAALVCRLRRFALER